MRQVRRGVKKQDPYVIFVNHLEVRTPKMIINLTCLLERRVGQTVLKLCDALQLESR